MWWRNLPSWFSAIEAVETETKKVYDAKQKREDWWLDTTYKGKSYATGKHNKRL